MYNSNGQWVYDDLKQWTNGNTYKFAAYSVGTSDKNLPAESSASFNYDNHTLTISDYVSNDNNQIDLLLATSTEDLSSANVPVPFTFNHALAMIKFTLQSSLGDKNPITITGFKVEGMNTKGTVVIENSGTITWSNQSVETPAVAFTDNDIAKATTTTPAVSDEFVVIPQDLLGNLTVTFTVTIGEEGAGQITKDLKATIENPTWENGLRYNYVATITGTDIDVIEFAAPVISDWKDAAGSPFDEDLEANN